LRRRHAFGFITLALASGGVGAAACSDDEAPPPKPARDASETLFDGAKGDAIDPVPVDAPTGPFCKIIDASAVVFCSDFEQNAPLFGFDQNVLGGDGGATLVISDEGGATHPSFVLDVSLTQTASDGGADAGADAGRGGGVAAFLSKDLTVAGKGPNSYQHHEVELDFRVVGPASLAYVALSVLSFPSALIKEHGFAVYDGNVFGRLAPKDFAVRDDESLWHHARIVVERPAAGSTSSFTVRIDIDGTLVDNIGGVDPGATATSLIKVGGFATSPSAGGSLRAQFDNVVVRRW